MLGTITLGGTWLGGSGLELPISLVRAGRIQIADNQVDYHQGDVWTVVATVLDLKTEQPVEPGGIMIRSIEPNGKQGTVSIFRISEGVYEASLELDEPGIWHIEVMTTAPYQALEPALILVQPEFG